MKISNKTLGITGIICSPFLAGEMLSNDIIKSSGLQAIPGLGAIFEITYMAGWMCSIFALLRSGAAGDQKWTRNVFKIQLGLLSVAQVYNLWGAIGIGTDHLLFRILDLSWPVSNAFMLVTGIAIIKANVLHGWKRYAPLVVGLWLPVAMIPMVILGRVPASLYFGLGYSIIAWTLLGITAWKAKEREVVYNQFGYPKLAVVQD